MKKEIKLYSSVLYPVWLLALMPDIWIILIASIFIIQSTVLIGALKQLEIDDVASVWRKSILWNTFYGFVAYLVASGLFSLTLIVKSGTIIGDWFIANISNPLISNPFSNVFTILYSLGIMAISGFLIFIANRAISFRKTELNPLGVKKVSFFLAIFTAPYILLIPSISFYNSNAGIIHSLWIK